MPTAPNSFPGCFSQPHNFKAVRNGPHCPGGSRHSILKKGPGGSLAPGAAALTLSACFCCVETAHSVRSRSPTRCCEDCRRPARSSASPGMTEVRSKGGMPPKACHVPGQRMTGRLRSHLFFAGLLAECGPELSVIPSSQTLESLWSGYEPLGERPNKG